MQQLQVWALPFAVSLLLATGLTALLTRIAPQKGWVSLPRKDRWSARVVALYGGIPIFLAFSVAVLCFFPSRRALALWLLTLGMSAIGLTDDIAKLPPRAKLLGQGIIAALAVCAGIVLPLASNFWINAAVTMFWIIGITNALNLLDNMDGVAAGIAIIATAAVVLLTGPADSIQGPALCLLAAVAGFLIFNVNPARVFMGDVGALPIGFFLACACVQAVEPRFSRGASLFLPCLILVVPLFDTLLVSVTRRRNGRPISLGARDHSSHRLVFIGLSERQAAGLLWAMGALGASTALLAARRWGGATAGIAALFVLGAALFWLYLARIDLPAAWLSEGTGRVSSIPAQWQKLIAGAFLSLIDAGVIALAFYFAALTRPGSLDRAMRGGLGPAGTLALACQFPVLVAFLAVTRRWNIQRKKDVYPVVACVLPAPLLLAAALAIRLPRPRIEWPLILLDAVFAFLLVALGRASGRIFELALRRKTLAEAMPLAQPAPMARLDPAEGLRMRPPERRIAESAPARNPGMNPRSN